MALSRTQRAFLAAYEEYGTITEAARQVDCDRNRHYHGWMDNPEYKAAFEQAEEHAIQAIDREIRRRALEGIEEPVIYQGKFSYEFVRGPKGRRTKRAITINRKSDILLMFLAKAKRPETYRDNAKVELGMEGGKPLQINVRFDNPPPSE